MSEEHNKLFVVHWPVPVEGAITPTLCEFCGATRYSSRENIEAARSGGMKTACPQCAIKLVEENDGEISGSVRHGKVIER